MRLGAYEERRATPVERDIGDRIRLESEPDLIRFLLAGLKLVQIVVLWRRQAQGNTPLVRLGRHRKILPEMSDCCRHLAVGVPKNHGG